MIYSKFQDKSLSLLGFGTMRFPKQADDSIDEAQVAEMTRYAIEHGVNYFDTAWFYHSGRSEVTIGKVLKDYPRERFFLADKFPGQSAILEEQGSAAAVFEEQLRRCGAEYFDFYLLHNVCERNVDIFTGDQWGIIDYLKEQKRLGRIRHLGFSTHAELPCLRQFLETYGKDMEFCQIQLNYLDWTLQDAKTKYEMLTEYGIPVWVMEPVRGGKLAALNADEEGRLKALRPDASIASWGFRFLQGLPNVQMILSGMSNMAQMEDNVKTFSERTPLSDAETALVLDIAEGIKNSVPCTACRYCCDGCPMGLEIPSLLSLYNELRYAWQPGVLKRVEELPADKRPAACVACGACTQICPQNIDVPGVMADFSEKLSQLAAAK